MLTTVALLLSVSLAQAGSADAEAKSAFCEARLSDPHAIQRILSDDFNHLARGNYGGIGGGGVCWWHSRFTRIAAYLTSFRPDLPKLPRAAYRDIILKIRRSEYVEVPGYRNLWSFSADFANDVQERLNSWQLTDGIGRLQWMEGLAGNTEVTAAELAATMDDLHARVSRGEVVYQMLQFPGITSHAWLVIGSRATANGYKIKVIDSNDYAAPEYTYRRGDTQFDYAINPALAPYLSVPAEELPSFVPYTEQTREETELRRKLERECRR